MFSQAMPSTLFLHTGPPRLTNFCSTLDTRSHQFNLGKALWNWSLAGRAVLLVGMGRAGGGEEGVAVEEGGENLIKTMSQRRGEGGR